MQIAGYLLLSAGVFLADQKAKYRSRKFYQNGRCRTFGKGKASVTFQHVRNKGMAMNRGEKYPALVKGIHTAVILLLLPLYLVMLGRKEGRAVKTGMSLLLGGGVSNLFDRFRDGYVTDYVSFGFGPKRFRRLVFNLGDFAILIGAALMVLGAAFDTQDI